MLQRNTLTEAKVALPKHIAIDLEGVGVWAKENSKPLAEAYTLSFTRITELIEQQTKFNIPILTFFVMSPRLRGTEKAAILSEQFANFLKCGHIQNQITTNKIKISVLGKWYELSEQMVQTVRKIAEETKDYDSFFLNFCLNYDGQEELVDACKLIGRQIRIGKIDPEVITKEMIKENIYTSYFIPPDIIIRNGREKRLTSFLLWDSVGSQIHFTNKLFPDFTVDEFIRVLARR